MSVVPTSRRLAAGVAVCLVYAVLAALLLWPLFSNPANATLDPDRPWLAGWVKKENHSAQTLAMLRDMRLAQWIYAWNWHALTTAPLSFFGANMFHPTPNALAYSEHAVGKIVLTGPIFALSGNPVLAYQLDLWLCFALSGAAMYALLRHAGALPAAAFVGGFLYAFCPARLDMVFHTHLMTGQYLPLALLFLDRTLFARRARAAAAFALCLLLHMLCSYYFAYMALLGVPIYALGLVAAERGRVPWRGVALAAGAFAAVLLVFALVSLVYLQVRARGALWDYREVAGVLYPMSNHPVWAYLWPPALAAGAGRLARGCYAYLGAIPLALAAVGIASARRGSDVRRRTLLASLALALVSYVLSLGPLVRLDGGEVTLPYGWLMRIVPGFSSMRVPGRFALMLMVGFAVLAGLGLDRLLRRAAALSSVRQRWASGAAALVLSAVIAWEYGLGGLELAVRRETLGPERTAVYQALADLPPGPVLEIPGSKPDGLLMIEYQVQSVRHWKPLLTGSSGYAPPTYRFVEALIRRLPDAHALALLGRMTDLRYVVVHDAYLAPYERGAWADPPGLELLASFGFDRLFRVAAPPQPDLLPAMIACSSDAAACPEIQQLVAGRDTAPTGAPPS